MDNYLFFRLFFGTKLIRSAESIPIDACRYDCRIIRNKLGQYCISIPLPLETKSMPFKLRNKYGIPERIIALDPVSEHFKLVMIHRVLSLNGGKMTWQEL